MRPSEIREINSRLNRVEQQISKIPSRIGSGVGGSSSSGIVGYEAATKEELPNTDIPRKSFGFVSGNVYVRNPANNGWVSINYFE